MNVKIKKIRVDKNYIKIKLLNYVIKKIYTKKNQNKFKIKPI
jgi:hypothetical protein